MKRWCAHPFRLGSIVPSSWALARFMAQSALDKLDPEAYVLELGPGTGRLTRALLDAGMPAERLICIELDPTLIHYLRQTFSGALILQGNACFLEALLPQHVQGKIGAIVSGLPMLSFSELVRDKILEGGIRVMQKSGCFWQFTYSPFSSIRAQRFGLKKRHVGWVWANLPPANVWCYEVSPQRT